MITTATHAPPGHPFFASTGGILTLCLAVLTGVLVPVVLFRLSRQDRRAEVREAAAEKFREGLNRRFAEIEKNLASSTLALAVLVQRADDATITLATIPSLKAATEVLKSRMDEHDRWATQARAELIAADQARHG